MKTLTTAKHISRGDTIVEVLISMSILALVLVASFASSSRSLHVGTDAANRQEALAYAQNQVETIKNEIAAGKSGQITSLTMGQTFCYPTHGDDKGKLHIITGSDDTNCQDGLSGQYTTVGQYANNLVTIKSSWIGNGNNQNRLTLDYRLPGGFIATGPATNLSACGDTVQMTPNSGQIVLPGYILQTSPTHVQVIGGGAICNCDKDGSSYVGPLGIFSGGPCSKSSTPITCNLGDGGAIIVVGPGGTQVVSLGYICQAT